MKPVKDYIVIEDLVTTERRQHHQEINLPKSASLSEWFMRFMCLIDNHKLRTK